MEAPAAAEHLAGLEQSLEGLLAELRSVTTQLHVLAAFPAGLRGTAPARAIAAPLRAQAELLTQECALLRRELVRLRESGQLGEGAGRVETLGRPS